MAGVHFVHTMNISVRKKRDDPAVRIGITRTAANGDSHLFCHKMKQPAVATLPEYDRKRRFVL